MSKHKHQEETGYFSGSGIDLQEYGPRFSEWQTYINLLTALAAIILCFLLHTALVACAQLFANQGPASVFSFLYQPAIWWFFPAAAMTLSFEMVLQIWSIAGHRRLADAYSEWAAMQPKSYRGRTVYTDSRSTFRKLFLFFGVVSGFFTLFALNMHVTLTQQEFIRCGYAFQTCSTHSYSSIHAIYAVDGRWSSKHHSFIPSPDIVVDFEDNTRWSEYQWTETNRKQFDTNLLHFLIEKTGLQPQCSHLAGDLPHPCPPF